MKVIKLEDISSHGGSIRGYVTHKSSKPPEIQPPNEKIDLSNFQIRAKRIKFEWLQFLTNQKLQGKKIAAFGAAAKGTVFCNYVGIDSDFIDYCLDDTSFKQNKFIPGTNIPIYSSTLLNNLANPPDSMIILPWNFRKEIEAKLKPLMPKTQMFGR